MADLGAHTAEGYVPMKDVAARQGLSLKYLEKILPDLTKGGLIEGVHGKGGGYRLTRAPEDYTVGEILRLTEGDLTPVSCMEEGACTCENTNGCCTLPLWTDLYRMVNDYLDAHTLRDLM